VKSHLVLTAWRMSSYAGYSLIYLFNFLSMVSQVLSSKGIAI